MRHHVPSHFNWTLIHYRRLGTSYRVPPSRDKKSWNLEDGTARYPETSVRNYRYTLRNSAVLSYDIIKVIIPQLDHVFFLNLAHSHA